MEVSVQGTKRTRRKKLECDLRTPYYYRQGVLTLELTDNSSIAIHPSGQYVFVRRYDKQRRKFLVQTHSGRNIWTNNILQLRPMVDGKELHHTSFPLLIEQNYQAGSVVCFRTRGGFAFLKRARKCSTNREKYSIFKNGKFNLRIPKGFNFCLGYVDVV